MTKDQREKLKARMAGKPANAPTADVKPLADPQEEPAVKSPIDSATVRRAAKTVTYKCGHLEGVASFAQKPCQACRANNQRAKAAAKALKFEEKRAAAKPGPNTQRFPVGSYFEPRYVAENLWKAKLWIKLPSEVDPWMMFEGEGSGLEPLLRQLAKAYWDWAANPAHQTVS